MEIKIVLTNRIHFLIHFSKMNSKVFGSCILWSIVSLLFLLCLTILTSDVGSLAVSIVLNKDGYEKGFGRWLMVSGASSIGFLFFHVLCNSVLSLINSRNNSLEKVYFLGFDNNSKKVLHQLFFISFTIFKLGWFVYGCILLKQEKNKLPKYGYRFGIFQIICEGLALFFMIFSILRRRFIYGVYSIKVYQVNRMIFKTGWIGRFMAGTSAEEVALDDYEVYSKSLF